MTHFQLVFKYPDGDRIEIRDNNSDGEPHIDGTLINDGQTYVIQGVEWLVMSDDIGDSINGSPARSTSTRQTGSSTSSDVLLTSKPAGGEARTLAHKSKLTRCCSSSTTPLPRRWR